MIWYTLVNTGNSLLPIKERKNLLSAFEQANLVQEILDSE